MHINDFCLLIDLSVLVKYTLMIILDKPCVVTSVFFMHSSSATQSIQTQEHSV